jgi:Tol biopolymer transport system component
MTDSLERFLEDLSFEVPAGLVARAKAAADVSVARARQGARRTDAEAERTAIRDGNGLAVARHQWVLALVAVLLAVAIVATLFGVHALHFAAPTPAKHGFVPSRHHNGQVVVGGWTWAGSTSTSKGCPVGISSGDDPTCHSGTSRLIAIDPATGAEHTIISAPTGETVSDAAYSPDGSNIAYVIGPDADFDLRIGSAFGSAPALSNSSIWVLDSETGRTHRVTTCHCQQLGHLSWSPDGSRLAFSDGDPYDGAELYVIDADGTHRSQLTHFKAPQNATQPSWSPDGSWIAFSQFSIDEATNGFRPGSIDVIRPDGSGLAVLLDDLKGQDLGAWREPAWSPDGSKIAYVKLAAGPPGAGTVGGLNGAGYQLWLMDADGSQRTELFWIGRPSGPEMDDWAWGGPAWSPDGTQIAVVAAPQYTLWVMNADGSDPQSLSNAVGGDRPTWQPLP